MAELPGSAGYPARIGDVAMLPKVPSGELIDSPRHAPAVTDAEALYSETPRRYTAIRAGGHALWWRGRDTAADGPCCSNGQTSGRTGGSATSEPSGQGARAAQPSDVGCARPGNIAQSTGPGAPPSPRK
jgi:hypothetical protein